MRRTQRETTTWMAIGWLIVGGLATTSGCSTDDSSTDEPTASLPNILLISIDTLRSDHLGSYGYHRETSPTLDRLAAEGARAANSWSQSSSTIPTHASLFTGLLPHQHQTFTYLESLPEAAHTLAEHLGDHGYRTFCAASSLRFVPESGFLQGCDRADVFQGDDTPKNERTALVNRSVLDAVEASDAQPFFGFVHYFDPHEPYAVPTPWRHRWHPGQPTPKPEDTATYLQAHRGPQAPVDSETIEYLRALYDGGIAFQDAGLRNLLDALEARGRADNLLIVITSDHGEEFKEHGGFSHSISLHEELLRVPWLAHWPGRIPAGLVLDRPIQSVDLFPTLMDLLGLPAPDGLVGRSVAGELLGRPNASDDGLDLIVHQQNQKTWAVAATLETGRFKLVVHEGGEPQLFKLDDDPGGHRPLERDYPGETRRLLAMVDELGLESTTGVLQPDAATPDDEILEQLRALGYVDEVGGGSTGDP